MTRPRIPRKSKKWHKKNGYGIYFTTIERKVYFIRTFPPFRVFHMKFDVKGK